MMTNSYQRKQNYDKIMSALQEIKDADDNDFNELNVRIFELENKNKRLANFLESIVNLLKE